jgi:hypothetical protein
MPILKEILMVLGESFEMEQHILLTVIFPRGYHWEGVQIFYTNLKH